MKPDFDEFDSAPPPVRAPPKLTAPPRLAVKKPPALSSTVPAIKKLPSASSAASKPPPPRAVEALRYKLSQEDAELQSETIIPTTISTGLADANWKERLAAIESLHSWLSGGEIENVESELVVRYLSKKPGWKESNFQVSCITDHILLVEC